VNAVPAPGTSRAELTLRGLIIGVVITLVFTAANVFFGLKAGLTFATSIPAAVISMALLRMAKNATMQENNIVQTVASAAGTLSSIIFVLPGLVMIGWWTGFPYWTSMAICALGGTLGVMYSIPLRRALVTHSDLPYPEGVACAEVLKVGAEAEGQEAGDVEQTGKAGLMAVVVGSLVSAAFAIVVATRVFASDIAQYFRTGDRSVSGYDFNLSFALFAVGHLCGLWVGLAMLLGVIIGWGWAVPHFSPLHWADALSPEAIATVAWKQEVRFLGAGMIGVAAIWTLAKLVKPVVSGLASAMASSRLRAAGQGATLARTELDIPIGIVGVITVLCMIPIAWMLGSFSISSGLGSHLWLLAIGGVAFVVLMSFFVSTVCGYMAGLIGSSNSPLSGVGIIVVIIATLLLLACVHDAVTPDSKRALVAFALFITAVVFAVAAIANNNLQDLKTGQLVDATPWKQQVALVIGVLVGAAIIPPVLELVHKAYGFAGMPGADPARALAAPQAALISALARGVIQQDLNWYTIGIGGLIGVGLIVLDETLGRTTKSVRLPPLAAGLGIYLPTSTSLMIVVGAVVGWYFDRRADRTANPEATKQLGVLLASGMIVGEGIIGVVIAALVVFLDKAYPLALVGDSFANVSLWLGGIAFTAVIFAMYYWIYRVGRRSL
jgi:putative OPT family oligopeptide transporter